MKKYKSITKDLKEQSAPIEDLLNELKDMSLGNEDTRREFVKIITCVALSNEMVARSFMRKVGEAMRPIITNILNTTSSTKPDGGKVSVRTGGFINMDTSKMKSTKVNKI